jgi:hypothetical protein
MVGMSKRTRRLVLLGLPAAFMVALLAAWLLSPRTAITRANAEKIRKGMTLAEVEAILGGPARDEAPERGLAWPSYKGSLWASDLGAVRVGFGHEGRVVFTSGFAPRARQGPFVLIRHWLGL